MPYDNLISSGDVAGRLPTEVANDLLRTLPDDSAALRLFRRVNMSASQTRLPVLAALPTAYWVNGETGLKQTTEAAWDGKVLEARELAAIVPVPESVIADANFDIFGELKPLLRAAIARKLDAAIFFGIDKPAVWPAAIVPAATAAGNIVARGANDPAEGGIAADLSDMFATVEADGYDVNGALATRAYRGRLRDARDGNGVRLAEVSSGQAYGVDIGYPMRGLWPAGLSAAEVVAGDFAEGIIAVRQDVTYKVLTESVITNDAGAIIYNLAQQDMVALRVVARFGFQIGNTLNYDSPVEADRYPFGVLTSPAA